MQSSWSGWAYLAGYVVLVGSASFLQKFAMKDVSAFQINFLMAIGMVITAVPALWWQQGNLSIPLRGLPFGAPVGIMMALGSICYVLALSRMPVGLAAAISTSYVVLVVILSRLFLGEPIGWIKGIGLVLTVLGVALLSWESQSS
jgi:drug/metabolite transporter (DMT)-like permease